MNIASPFAIEFNHKEWLNEYNIIYKQKNKIEDIIRFLSENEDKRINIWFKDESFDIELIKTLNKLHSQLYVVFQHSGFFVNKEVQELVANNIKFYFTSLVGSFSELNYYLALGCKEFYPAGDLMYDLPTVKKICTDNNVKMRIVLNRIATNIEKSTVKDVFFRPQDLDIVQEYFDTAEFVCGSSLFDPTDYDWRTFKVLYRHWFEREKWIGDLQEINPDLDFALPCESIPKQFFTTKISCQIKCYKGKSCNHCENYYNTAMVLKEKGIIFDKRKT